MQKGHVLHFDCLGCDTPIHFSILELDKLEDHLSCTNCKRTYSFEDTTLKRQLQKFEKLCRTIADSEEILSNTSVGISLEGKEVKVPYKILLTRLSSLLDLVIEGKRVSIEFRLEPLVDHPISKKGK